MIIVLTVFGESKYKITSDCEEKLTTACLLTSIVDDYAKKNNVSHEQAAQDLCEVLMRLI